jgi:hypothetical protein
MKDLLRMIELQKGIIKQHRDEADSLRSDMEARVTERCGQLLEQQKKYHEDTISNMLILHSGRISRMEASHTSTKADLHEKEVAVKKLKEKIKLMARANKILKEDSERVKQKARNVKEQLADLMQLIEEDL